MKLLSTKLLTLFVLLSLAAHAQDIHFSQNYFSPLTLNPALTGDFDGSYRIGSVFREQTGNIMSGGLVYQTPSIYGDVSLFKGSRSGSCLGIGGMIFNDQQGDGRLSNMTMMGSLAWHQSIDGAGNYFISGGIQAGYVQYRLDPTKLNFYDQWTGVDFKNATGDVVGPALSYFDLNAGLSFSAIINENSRATVGFGAFHLNKPRQSFLNGGLDVNNPNFLSPRFAVHASSSFMINRKVFLYPNVIYELQNADNELVVGTLVGLNFSQRRTRLGTIVYAGLAYRTSDAVIPSIGFITKGLQFGVAYDYTVSTLGSTNGNQGLGAFEIGAKFIGHVYTPKRQKRIFCPRM